MKITWHGDRIIDAADVATRKAIDHIMSNCVIHAKNNHSGWRNITSTAEGSIQIQTTAVRMGSVVFGIWGSRNVHYFIWLELKHGAALRRAADRYYPKLSASIRAFKREVK